MPGKSDTNAAEHRTAPGPRPPKIAVLAVPETSGAVLYSLYEVLQAAGTVWPQITGEPAETPGFDVAIVARDKAPFSAVGGVPIAPQADFAEASDSDIIIAPDLALDIQGDPRGLWPEEAGWIRRMYERGAILASVCTGSILIADSGVLNGEEATTHWAARDLFTRFYPEVRLRPERMLCPAGEGHRIVTSGGASAWAELALYLIRRFCGPEEARKAAKLFLLGDHGDGQLPYAAILQPCRHEDAVIAQCQSWIAQHYDLDNPVTRMVAHSGLAERSFKRRFRAATGYTPVAYVQALRIEEAKQLLEVSDQAVEAIGAEVGYQDPAFFRRLFKRQTGVTPARYRQRFQSIGQRDPR